MPLPWEIKYEDDSSPETGGVTPPPPEYRMFSSASSIKPFVTEFASGAAFGDTGVAGLSWLADRARGGNMTFQELLAAAKQRSADVRSGAPVASALGNIAGSLYSGVRVLGGAAGAAEKALIGSAAERRAAAIAVHMGGALPTRTAAEAVVPWVALPTVLAGTGAVITAAQPESTTADIARSAAVDAGLGLAGKAVGPLTDRFTKGFRDRTTKAAEKKIEADMAEMLKTHNDRQAYEKALRAAEELDRAAYGTGRIVGERRSPSRREAEIAAALGAHELEVIGKIPKRFSDASYEAGSAASQWEKFNVRAKEESKIIGKEIVEGAGLGTIYSLFTGDDVIDTMMKGAAAKVAVAKSNLISGLGDNLKNVTQRTLVQNHSVAPNAATGVAGALAVEYAGRPGSLQGPWTKQYEEEEQGPWTKRYEEEEQGPWTKRYE